MTDVAIKPSQMADLVRSIYLPELKLSAIVYPAAIVAAAGLFLVHAMTGIEFVSRTVPVAEQKPRTEPRQPTPVQGAPPPSVISPMVAPATVDPLLSISQQSRALQSAKEAATAAAAAAAHDAALASALSRKEAIAAEVLVKSRAPYISKKKKTKRTIVRGRRPAKPVAKLATPTGQNNLGYHYRYPSRLPGTSPPPD